MAKLAAAFLAFLFALLLPAAASAQTVTGNLTQTRTSGTAPLAVLFNATGTTCSGSCNAFHELHYSWDFDDDPNAVFAVTGKKKNIATGPVAAHLFESPGTYNVTVSITSKSGGSDVEQVTITVANPDTTWSGTNTICFSSSGTFDTGGTRPCPTGASHVTTSALATVESSCTGAKRCLLRRGETFSGGNLDIGGTGPGMIADYGPTGNTPPLVVHTSGQSGIGFNQGTTDWRVVRLRVSGTNSSTSQMFASSRTATNVLLWGNDNVAQTYNCGVCYGASVLNAFNDDLHDGVFVFENTLFDFGVGSGGNVVFLAARNFAVVGNYLNDSTSGEHIARITHGDTGVVTNNYLGKQADTKATLTLRSSDQNDTCTAGCSSPAGKIVVGDNYVLSLGGYPMVIGPANASDQQAIVNNVIFERNFVARDPNSPTGGATPGAFQIGESNTSVSGVTMRNNICKIQGSWSLRRCFKGGNRAHGNTCYSGDSLSVINCVQDTDDAYNNLLYAPNTTTRNVTNGVDNSAGNLNATSNPFTGTPAYDPQDYVLGASSAPKDAGSTTPYNPVDFNLFTRLETSTPDLGAFDESTEEGTAPDPPDPPDPPPVLLIDHFAAWRVSDQASLYDPFTGQAALDYASGFAVEAVPGEQTPGSVVFSISCDNGGPTGTTGTENVAPYAQNDDAGVFRQYEEFAAGYAGTCTLTATPYTLSGGGGTAGTALQVTFSVVDSTPAPPVPASPSTAYGVGITGGSVP